ncbi:hypothetical protein AB3S75_047044 [Citrus x aurantiifolia]
MPLLVNGHQNSTNNDGKLKIESSSHAESNGGGGDLPCNAMALESNLETMNTQVADRRQNNIPDGSGWSEMAEGIVGNKTQVVASLKTSSNSASFHGFDRWLSGRFPVVRMAWR